MKTAQFLSTIITFTLAVVSARRITPIPNNNVHRMGWGLDDDVYFDEPQEVTTFADDKDVKAIKSVKRVVTKPVEKLTKKPEESKVGPWGLPDGVDLEDMMGFE